MGKKRHDLPKPLRQELIINIIEKFSGTEGMMTSDIYELLENRCPGVNRRTLYRDLDELSSRYPIYDEIINGKSRWYFEKDSKENLMKGIYREYLQRELVAFLNKKQVEESVTAI